MESSSCNSDSQCPSATRRTVRTMEVGGQRVEVLEKETIKMEDGQWEVTSFKYRCTGHVRIMTAENICAQEGYDAGNYQCQVKRGYVELKEPLGILAEMLVEGPLDQTRTWTDQARRPAS
jgi:hypothetical protein